MQKLQLTGQENHIEIVEYVFVEKNRKEEVRFHIRGYHQKPEKKDKEHVIEDKKVYISTGKHDMRMTWHNDDNTYYLYYRSEEKINKEKIRENLINMFKSI